MWRPSIVEKQPRSDISESGHTTAAGDKLIRIPAFAFLYLLGHTEKNGYQAFNL
jgi:hypothetical protein